MVCTLAFRGFRHFRGFRDFRIQHSAPCLQLSELSLSLSSFSWFSSFSWKATGTQTIGLANRLANHRFRNARRLLTWNYVCRINFRNRGSNQLRKIKFVESFQAIVALIASPDCVACVASRDSQSLQNNFGEFILAIGPKSGKPKRGLFCYFFSILPSAQNMGSLPGRRAAGQTGRVLRRFHFSKA